MKQIECMKVNLRTHSATFPSHTYIKTKYITPSIRYIASYRKYHYYRQHNKKLRCLYYHYKLSYLSKKYGYQIGEGTEIGKEVYIEQKGNITINNKVTIGDYVWIGKNTIIEENVTIGDNVVISPNSHIKFDVPSNSVVV